MQRNILLLLMMLLSFSASAQSLPESEGRLSALFETLKTTYIKEECVQISSQIEAELYEALKTPESFLYPFESLNFLGKIYSDDQLLRIYTWNVPFPDGTFTYGSIVQQKVNNALTVLKAKDPAYKPPIDKYVAVNNWYGALYYRAIPVTHKKETYYVLLGWIGNDDLTNLKVIDALTFNEKGKMQLGLPVFKKKNRASYRVLFEYGNEYTMTLDYDKKSKQIIFDRLMPSTSRYEGIYTHYGPSFIYDSFQLKKKGWIWKEDIDARNNF